MRRTLVLAALSLLGVASLAACGGTTQSESPIGPGTTAPAVSTQVPASDNGSDVTSAEGAALTDAQVNQLESDVNSVQGTVDQLDQLSSEQ